ncbi:spore germination protein [Paenibacillus daejeonensis]|uniref:spore germination protein n=1 Tax=Paenibacillus daejeonensis TaxID=135193 RepID=UPI00036BFA8F|nr:spore germination protein [Paenibacillus daejeonensis]
MAQTEVKSDAVKPLTFISDMRQLTGDSTDIIYRYIELNDVSGWLIYVEGLADPRQVLTAIHEEPGLRDGLKSDASSLYDHLKHRTITEGKLQEEETLSAIAELLLSGYTVIFLDGMERALCIDTGSLKQRQVQEPASQSVVRGPREGFTESLRDNIALVRRRVKNAALRITSYKLGQETRTETAVMYLENKADPEVVAELQRRIKKMNLESVLESNSIEEMIQDQQYSPFPTVYNSERPDVIAAGVLEGRIAIFVDGTPFVLLVPALFMQFFQSSEDYNQRGDFGSLVRLLRYFCFAISLLTPSFYIAVTTFHQEMIPTNLLLSLIGQREGIPFPAFIEALIMEVTFEILREAGIRLPKSIGQSVSIVGTIVIGQAAVEAGFVSAAMVIVVSLTAISNFALPAFNMAISIRMLRFVIMALAASFGLYGMIIAMIMLALHLCQLQSLGVPYMTSFAPFNGWYQKDTLVRLTQPMVQRLKKKRDGA